MIKHKKNITIYYKDVITENIRAVSSPELAGAHDAASGALQSRQTSTLRAVSAQ